MVIVPIRIENIASPDDKGTAVDGIADCVVPNRKDAGKVTPLTLRPIVYMSRVSSISHDDLTGESVSVMRLMTWNGVRHCLLSQPKSEILVRSPSVAVTDRGTRNRPPTFIVWCGVAEELSHARTVSCRAHTIVHFPTCRFKVVSFVCGFV